jgi:hypothetical protein
MLPEAEFMGMGLNTWRAPYRDDGECALRPHPGAGPGSSPADFDGEDPRGIWLVCVGDSGWNDAGVVDRVTLTVNRVG